ncbi:MAG: FKBP-type peptidyl-prolyl cis-trans isomerase [Flavobacteriales bacterium]|nr:FKBP-type peptidyl-prolyl cis-trans isomerase [Flavobacteriales bacterium]
MNERKWFAALVVLCACGRSPYAGFKQVDDETFLRHHVLGEGEAAPSDEDSVLLRVRVARLGEDPGSFLSTERWYLARDLRRGAMAPVLRRIHEGDSMSVIAPQRRWPWKEISLGAVPAAMDTVMLRAEIALIRLRTPAMISAEMSALQRSDPIRFEQQVIARWIAEDGRDWQRWGTSDLFYRMSGAARDTARLHAGDRATVSWAGERLIEGTAFDERPTFSWRFGDSDQVIKGLEVAASLLRPGQEGLFIIPSAMAFGDRGVPGTLEPHSPVLYRVALIDAERTTANH